MSVSCGCSAKEETQSRGIRRVAHTCPRLLTAKYRDVFISYGHTPETNAFAKKLSTDLCANNITTWIDTVPCIGNTIDELVET